MKLKPLLSAREAAANMAEIEPKYTPQEALVEADRCLYCFDAPCIMACPTGIDIPSFIKKIANGNLTGSARVILQANPLGGSCARVCPTTALCEGACVMLDRDEKPIKIGRLQRYATDHVFDNKISVLGKPKVKTGKSVAVIGGGPAGLGCAAELAQLGYEVTIYEKEKQAGGLNTYGIAYYKLRPEDSLAEVELVKSLGVKIKTGVEVGKQVKIADLEKQFDAIFVGIGLGRTYRLGIPGEDLPEVFEALDFIKLIHTMPLNKVPVGRRVAVIGCGNTAIDAVTQAKRLGAANSIIVYRRGEKDMPAYPYEYDIAKADGCEFMFHTVPVEVVAEKGRVVGLKLARTKVNREGRLEVVKGSEFVEPFDMVIKALGQEPQSGLLKKLFPKLRVGRDGTVTRDAATGQTSLKHVFAGGDCANGGREVVNAVGEGKKAARGIHKWLTGERVAGPVQATRIGVAGPPFGSGLDNPVRVPELEAEYYGKQ
ncbi:MAG TPA: NAD(P)-dependent oxidoreductase [Kiritimatiellia bacterium]|nr:NAD(P)-dependent oxidoreductase [Kiritimatiellia bacterium]